MRNVLISALIGLILPLAGAVSAEDTATMAKIRQWKAVFGKIEARNTVPARAQLGGTLTKIGVSEGSDVSEGQQIATVYDAKLALQLGAVEAQIGALQSQLDNAETEFSRGEDLLARGVTTKQRLDALRTQVDVLKNQIEATGAEKQVIEQRAAEGAVLAPISGRVLSVPVTPGSVVMPGEAVAMIGGGGFFLRLAVPERHAAFLSEGDEIQIGEDGETRTGKLAKVYPLIENGRVIADVDMGEDAASFVNARVLVRLPVGETSALLVPAELVVTRMGLDFVSVKQGDHAALRAIVPGEHHVIEGRAMVEVLSGLREGEVLVPASEPAYTPAKDAGHD